MIFFEAHPHRFVQLPSRYPRCMAPCSYRGYLSAADSFFSANGPNGHTSLTKALC
jgi:hypothetical protein